MKVKVNNGPICGGACAICDESCLAEYDRRKAENEKLCACGMATAILCENNCVGEAVKRDKLFSTDKPAGLKIMFLHGIINRLKHTMRF